VWFAIPQPTEWQHVGNQIDPTSIFVSVKYRPKLELRFHAGADSQVVARECDYGDSSGAPFVSCASGAACGARISKGRLKCSGGAVSKLFPPATTPTSTHPAAMK